MTLEELFFNGHPQDLFSFFGLFKEQADRIKKRIYAEP